MQRPSRSRAAEVFSAAKVDLAATLLGDAPCQGAEQVLRVTEVAKACPILPVYGLDAEQRILDTAAELAHVEDPHAQRVERQVERRLSGEATVDRHVEEIL